MFSIGSKDIVECLVFGATILGTGGGGSPETGKASLESDLRAGRKLRVLDIDEVADDALLVSPYYVGSIAPGDKANKKATICCSNLRKFTCRIIRQSLPKSAVEQHLHRTYTDSEVPDQVKHATLRVAALGLMKIGIKKSGSLIRMGDYVVELSDPTIFTAELKAEIADFVLGRTSHIATSAYQTEEIKQRWGED